ncbi:MAG: DUF2252 domain-containing protein, partial [Actinomycetota bacterium]|nr:DUF2252 domain-containing protein [Actinomycetota bacterium]
MTDGHVVLAETDGEAYASLSSRATSRTDRYAHGKRLRRQVPRSSFADWTPPVGRRDPVEQIRRSHEGRLDWLVPVRVARMVESPYGFLRGAATIMAEDFAHLPATGITPVICGDAHLGNFGFYGSPERDLVLDLNDFDEAHPGAWEWDLRRLATSVWVAGRQNGSSERGCEEAAVSCVAAYRAHVRYLADEPLLSRSFQRLTTDQLEEAASESSLRKELRRAAKRARNRTSDRALPRFTTQHQGQRRIVEEPPLITRVTGGDAERITGALDDYLATLASHWRRVLAGYTVVD